MADYLGVMSKSVFQSGISWKVVDAKWPGIRAAFHDFDPRAIAAMTPEDIDALVADTRVIRNRRKLQAGVDNARRMLELDDEHGGFREYLRSKGAYDEIAADLNKQFCFMGEMGIYHFMWVVSEEVPPYEEWSAGRH